MMRRFIDIVESPVEDIHLVGGHKHYPMGVPAPTTDRARDLELFQQGHAFGDTDSRLIQSPKAQAKIYRAFSKTPHRFEIIFQNAAGEVSNSKTDNASVDNIAVEMNAGIHDSFGGIDGKAGVIRVLLMSNLSPLEDKMPMTSWTIAHKIGHAFQDHITNRGATVAPIALKARKLEQIIQIVPPRFFTMKSARNEKLKNPFEKFPEMVAQYLITGRFTLDKVGGTANEIYYGNIEDRANAALDELFSMLNGKVLVEV